MVLKELLSNSFSFRRVWWSVKGLIFNHISFGGCDVFERNPFLTVSPLGGVMVLKDLIFNSFHFGRMWWL